MRGPTKLALTIFCASLILLPAGSALKVTPYVIHAESLERRSAGGAQEFKEYNFRYDGTKWVPGWLQCDAEQEVLIFGVAGKRGTLRYESFPKRQPARKTVLSLHQRGEPDCGMMKCTYTLVAPAQTVSVRESHYKDEAYWTSQYWVTISRGKGRTLPEQQCRWFERTRLAVITDRRTIYVTEDEAGQIQYQSYNYQQAEAQPSVTLKGGTVVSDERRRAESFTFQSGDYQYILTVSTQENRPFVEVLVKKRGILVQQERCLSYTYLKKP